MLTLDIKGVRLLNEQTLKFTIVSDQTLKLEHSLYSIAKWEEKWCIPFIESENPYLRKKEWEKTEENMLDYIRCMTINKDVDPNIYRCLTQSHMATIKDYIVNPKSASFFNDDKSKSKHDNHIVTSEYIYAQMATLGIPFSCEKWHFNRLMNLIRMCNQLQSDMGGTKGGPSKMKTMREWAALNAARRKR